MTKVFLNIFMNVVFTFLFVIFYNLSFAAGHEETFVALAMTFGSVVVVTNAVYVAVCCRKKPSTN